MIAKNIKGQSFAGCVNYVMKKGAEVLKAEGFERTVIVAQSMICIVFTIFIIRWL